MNLLLAQAVSDTAVKTNRPPVALDLARAHAALIEFATTDARVLKTPAPAAANAKFIDNGRPSNFACGARLRITPP